jgi:hypothetical protein
MKSLAAAASLFAMIVMISPVLAGPPLRLTFDNQSNHIVQTLLVRIAGAKPWGANRLAKALPPHTKAQVLVEDGSNKCVLDLAVVTTDGIRRNFWRSFCNDRTFKFYGSP